MFLCDEVFEAACDEVDVVPSRFSRIVRVVFFCEESEDALEAVDCFGVGIRDALPENFGDVFECLAESRECVIVSFVSFCFERVGGCTEFFFNNIGRADECRVVLDDVLDAFHVRFDLVEFEDVDFFSCFESMEEVAFKCGYVARVEKHARIKHIKPCVVLVSQYAECVFEGKGDYAGDHEVLGCVDVYINFCSF